MCPRAGWNFISVVYFADFHLNFILQWLHIFPYFVFSGRNVPAIWAERNCLGKGLVNPPPSAQCNWVIAFGFTMHSLAQARAKESCKIYFALFYAAPRERADGGGGKHHIQSGNLLRHLVARRRSPVQCHGQCCFAARALLEQIIRGCYGLAGGSSADYIMCFVWRAALFPNASFRYG